MSISKEINQLIIKVLCLVIMLLPSWLLHAQPTPKEYLYVWAWNGIDLWEKPDNNSLKKKHLNYGDSVFLNKKFYLEDEFEIEIFGQTVEYGKEFPQWKVKSGWESVSVSIGEEGFIPKIYLSKLKPFKFSQKAQLATEKINDYFIRTKGVLEIKKVKKEDIFRAEAIRYVFKSGIIFEMPYSITQRPNFTLLIPDMSLVASFFFLNTVYNLEMEKRGGKSDNIRLITADENSLLFTNTYLYSGVESKKRKIYFLQKVHDFVIITVEEVEVD